MIDETVLFGSLFEVLSIGCEVVSWSKSGGRNVRWKRRGTRGNYLPYLTWVLLVVCGHAIAVFNSL